MDQNPYEGTWEGELQYQKGGGLYNPDWPPDVWRLTIKDNAARVFIKRDAAEDFKESKPGKYKMEIYMTNVLIFAITSGGDEDGVWVETQTFVLTQKGPDTLGAILAGAVNNTEQPLDRETSKFFYLGTGELLRTGLAMGP
ncbi:hypothetical protein JQ574_34110 [Bradyrhizobium sp. AUGA SZCCT0158]|uniref:hypothetical protein n=1 Tax=Bradyrhizobium sp. AUGA SZCCT0158 TaxID=2807661 RepID=UPI001BACFE7E|nr:hypothetical protein [Bradyrhizobium sp. AUGA SZCCT0158]MBR1201042.1 hypothetical protein [Bradyrhizobium sp. AUGA SZCCT0158]